MIRIVFLIRSLDRGGAEGQLVTLVKALDRERFDPTVLCLYSGGDLEKDLQENGVRVLSLEKRGRWDLSGFARRLIDRLRNAQPDVLYGYMSVPNLLTVIAKPFFRSTRMVWGIRASNVDLSRYVWLERVAFVLQRLLSPLADLIIVNSSAGREYHAAHGFASGRMVVVPNGIDTDRFSPDPEAGAKVRAEWGVPEGAVLIGLVGRLDPMKDHPTFLKAAALFSKGRRDARFACVGGGPEGYARKLRQLADELGLREKVIWAGPRSDVPSVHNAFDIASSSSSGEGFPNVVGEAMSCGVPCVVTDVGDSAWIVGETGVVVPARDPQALARGWAACLQRNTSELGIEARSRVRENFSVGRLVERTERAVIAAR